MKGHTIWKTHLDITDSQKVDAPEGAVPISVAFQGDDLCLWFYCNQSLPTKPFVVNIYGTGRPIPGGRAERFVGTVQHEVEGTALVWHVFWAQVH